MSNMMIDEREEDSAEELAEEQALQNVINGVEPVDTKDVDTKKDIDNDNNNKEIDDEDFDEADNEDLDDELNADDEDNNDEEKDKDSDDNSDNASDDFETLSVNVNGVDIEINSDTELREVVKKLTEDKPFEVNNEREMLDQAGLSEDDISLLADIKSGSKAALNELLKRQNVTLDDLDDARDEKYSKEFKFEEVTEVQAIAKQIMGDETFLGEYNTEVGKLPKDFAEAIHSDATAMKHFVKHVKSGLTKELIPAATKESTLKGIPFMEAYAKIGRELAGKKTEAKSEAKKEKREVKEESRSRRAKRSQNRSSTQKEPTAADINAMSEEDFVAKYGE